MSTTNNKNLGHVTAYGYAKSQGYTGTEEEYAALMASYADVGQTAVDAALAAQTAKGKAEDAQEAAETAQGKAEEAQGKAEEAQTYAQTAQAAAEQAAREALAGAGTPLVAQTAAAMTDQTKIYVYLGSETGYTSGNWYYWDGSAWTSGGVYNAEAINTDTTLTVPGAAADAEATGDAINLGLTENTHDYAADEETDWIITAGSAPFWAKQGTATQSRAKIFRVPKGATKLKLTPNSSGGAIFTFLKSYAPAQGATPDYAAGWSRMSPSGTAELEYALGADCAYMYTTVTLSTGTDKTPTSVTFVCVRPGKEEYALDSVDTDTSDESGKHDRSKEIMLALSQHGVCRLREGIYYISGITMPSGSKLIGDGRNTIIRLLASVTSGTAIKMGASCELRDVTVSGAYADRTPSTTVGTRNGIEWTGSGMVQGVVSGCDIKNFDGAGIYLHDTTTDLQRNLAISDCLIRRNDAGIDIRKNAEFNRIVNCTIYKNGYGVRNRGGNNNISNCGIDGNTVGVLVDNAEGSNWGHGTITGCSVNHSDSNNGYGLIVDGAGQMLVSNCNFYYSKIKLNDTKGNVISNCGFGSSVLIEVIDGACSLVTNCMFRRASTSDPFPISISGNTAAKFINCYDRDGYLYEQA